MVVEKSKNCEEVSEDDEAILMIMRFQRELEGEFFFCVES